MDHNSCPAPETLKAFHEDRLTDDESNAVADHFARCGECAKKYKEIPECSVVNLVVDVAKKEMAAGDPAARRN